MIKLMTALIAALLLSSVTALAVEVDERDGDPATPVREAGLGGGVLSARPDVADVPEHPPVTLDPEIADRMQPPDTTVPDFGAERPSAPAMPDGSTAPVGPPARQRGPGRDCGTPTRSDGADAERSAEAGDGTIILRIHPCHSFEWEQVDHQVRFSVPGAAMEKVVFDYGDGQVEEHAAFPCDIDTGARQEVVVGIPHRYEAAGRYTLTARVTWLDCGSQERQTTTVSIAVFRD